MYMHARLPDGLCTRLPCQSPLGYFFSLFHFLSVPSQWQLSEIDTKHHSVHTWLARYFGSQTVVMATTIVPKTCTFPPSQGTKYKDKKECLLVRCSLPKHTLTQKLLVQSTWHIILVTKCITVAEVVWLSQ